MTEAELNALQLAGIIDGPKRAEIIKFLTAQDAAPQADNAAPAPRFDVTHVLWYGGALIIIGAMSLFTTDAFDRLGVKALASCGLVYGIVLWWIGQSLWKKQALRVPGGLLITAAVAMVPLTIYGIQDATGWLSSEFGNPGTYHDFYAWINGGWVYMEIGTIIASVLAVWRYRFPFILLMAAYALWFMSMDVAMLFTPTATDYWDFETRRNISILFGLAMIVAAWAWDITKGRKPDLMFWIHLFGALTFWAGLTLHDGSTELQKFIYLILNIAMVGFSLFIDRRVYAVFGALGIASYLGDVAYNEFKDVIAFSFALSAIGLAIIFAGLWLNKNKQCMATRLSLLLPPLLQKLRPADVS